MTKLHIRSHPIDVCPQHVLGAQRGPAVATGSVKGKGLEGAAGTVPVKSAMGARPVASVALATLRRSATAAIWYVRVGSQKMWCGAGIARIPACPSLYCLLFTQHVLVPVPAAQDLRNPTVCSVRKAGPCIISSV